MPLSQLVPSLIRTYVPLFVAWLAGWLVSLGIPVDDSTQLALASGIGAIVAGIYYALARWLETKFPAVGILLGYIRQPVYVNPLETPAQQKVELSTAVKTVAKDAPPSRT